MGGTIDVLLWFLALTTVLKQPNGEPFDDNITSPSRGLRAEVDGVSGINEDDFDGCIGVWKTMLLRLLLTADEQIGRLPVDVVLLLFPSALALPPTIAPRVTASRLSLNSSLKRASDIFLTCVGNLMSSKWKAC